MPNVFTYPLNESTNWTNPDPNVQVNLIDRAAKFLSNVNDDSQPYTPVLGDAGLRYEGIDPRSTNNFLQFVSRFRKYYETSGLVSVEDNIDFFDIQYLPVIAITVSTIRLEFDGYVLGNPLQLTCLRRPETYTRNPVFGTPSDITSNWFVGGTNTHGMGGQSVGPGFAITSDGIGIPFMFDYFPTAVAGWGNIINGDIPGPYYLKVVDSQTVEVYTDPALTVGVDATAWGSPDLSVATGTPGYGQAYIDGTSPSGNHQANRFGQVTSATLVHPGTKEYFQFFNADDSFRTPTAIDFKPDNIRSWADVTWTSPVEFARVWGGKAIDSGYVVSTILYDTLTDVPLGVDQYFLPKIDITVKWSGLPQAEYVQGESGWIIQATLDPERCGLIYDTSQSFSPGDYSPDTDRGQFLYEPVDMSLDLTVVDDPLIFQFRSKPIVGNPLEDGVTVQFSQVYNFPTSLSEPITFSGITYSGVGGELDFTSLNGKLLAIEKLTTYVGKLYEFDGSNSPPALADFSVGLDRTHGGTGASILRVETQSVDNGSNSYTSLFFPGPLSPEDPTGEQKWPTIIAPSKAELTVIQPTRVSFSQTLDKYRNSLGAYGYQVTYQYNYITNNEWRVFEDFIRSMRGQFARFQLPISNWDDGGNWNPFPANTTTNPAWLGRSIKPLKVLHPAGSSNLFLRGFAPEVQVTSSGEFLGVSSGNSTYRATALQNNWMQTSGVAWSNMLGEAVVRLAHPLKSSITDPSVEFFKFDDIEELQVTMNADEIVYDFHPRGFVSFQVKFDVV